MRMREWCFYCLGFYDVGIGSPWRQGLDHCLEGYDFRKGKYLS